VVETGEARPGEAEAAGAADAHDSLRKVLNYAHAAAVKDGCVWIPVTRQMVLIRLLQR